MSVFQGTSLLSLVVSHQGTVSCPVPGFTQSCKVPREIENNAYANFWMDNKEYHGIFEKGL